MKKARTILITAIAASVLALCGAARAELPSPVAHWAFDEGAGSVAYDSAGDNDGVVYGAEWVDGILDGALDFDAVDDYVGVPDDPSLRVNQSASFSVSVWAKPYSNRMINSFMLSKMRAEERRGVFGYSLAWQEQTSKFRFVVEDSWHGSTSLYSSEVPPGSWYHVAIVYDNKDVKIYVNGGLHNSDTFAYDTADTEPDKEFVIGARSFDSVVTDHFDGSIDDVRFYDRALSAGEIEELYGQEPNDGLVAHWKFDEAGGSVAYDSAGDNDGAISGAQWADGFIGGALNFDGGNDYVEAASSEELKLNLAGSVSVWIKPGNLYRHSIVSKRGGSQLGNWYENYWLTLGTYNQCSFIIADGSNWASATIPEEDLAVDTWQHVAGTWDPCEVKIYLDGRLIDAQPNTTVSDLIRSDAWPLRIGYHHVDGWFFDGLIDDVRIYARALSAEGVLGLYEAVPEVPEAEVYHVDGDGGSDLNDGLSRATAFATIQKGIDSSLEGGEVLVWPGVYSQAINFLGKAITVRSAGDAAAIEAPGQDAVTFHSGEGADSVIKNLVIRNSGLGISANYGSSPTISNLTIVDNDFGIAAYEDSNPDISNCILWDNRDGDMWGCQARYSFVEQEIETGPVDGLIAHWKFDEGRGTTAGDSAGDNDGAINGAQWVAGESGGALSFDGANDYVSIPDSDVFDVNGGDISIGMWFKTSVYANQTLMKLRQYDDDPHLEVYNSMIYGNLGTRAMPGGAIVAYNAGRVDDGGWHHVAVSLENGTTGGYKLYLDGTLVGISTFSGRLSSWDAIAIGNDASGGGYFNGSIDDIRVYNRAISSLEAYLLYEMSREGPIAHWEFDEGAGSIAYDSAGSNDGVVYGAQWTTGQVGEALDLDGVDDCVVLPDNSPVWLPEYDFAYSLWAWFDAPASVSGQDTLLDLNCTTSSDPINDIGCAFKRVESGKIGFYMVTITGGEQALYSNDVFGEGEWRHLVALREGGTLAIYVNGSLENSATCSASQIDYTGGSYDDDGVSIGRTTSTNSPNGLFFLDGKLDDVRIYDRALSAAEVELLYGGGLIGRDDTDTLRPLFADAGAGDYHLLSERGRYWPEHDVWVLDKASSPCIDAGDPTIEPSGEPMPNGGAINMGAYGGTEYASMSEWPILSDYDRNGRSDFGDFAIFCDEWLMELPWAGSGSSSPVDTTPPAALRWIIEPDAVSHDTVVMIAYAEDASGVEYIFTNVTLGYDSGWQEEPNWIDTGLQQGTIYCYTLQVRDMSPAQNWRQLSGEACARTLMSTDSTPPQPDPMTWPDDPNMWPAEIYIGPAWATGYGYIMTCTVAADPSGPVQYWFQCHEEPSINSGWIAANTWITPAFTMSGQNYGFRVKARDAYGNEAAWSEVKRPSDASL